MVVNVYNSDLKKIIIRASSNKKEDLDDFNFAFNPSKFSIQKIRKDNELIIASSISNLNEILKLLEAIQSFHGFKLVIDDSLYSNLFHFKELSQISEQDLIIKLKEKGFKRDLFSFQLRNLSNLSRFNIGAELSVPGGGKTSVALAYFSLLRKKNSKLVIICPLNAMIAWDREMRDCLESSSINKVNFHGIEKFNRIHDLTLPNINSDKMENQIFFMTTYTQLHSQMDSLTEFMRKNDVFLFLDESHRMKKGDSGFWGRNCLKLKDYPSHKLILSGTPITNDISDLSAQLKFLYSKNISESDLIPKLNNVMVRTTKADLPIPELESEIRTIGMTEEQIEIDELFNSKLKKLIYDEDQTIQHIEEIQKILIYRIMLSSNPLLLRKRMIQDGFSSELLPRQNGLKIQEACRIARELYIKGEKVVIWSFFRENIEIINDLLRDLGSQFIHGGVDTGEVGVEGTRDDILDKFENDSNYNILVANPSAAGEGISLHHSCQKSIYVDRTFNAGHFLQSRDRIHRIGLPKDKKPKEIILVNEKNNKGIDKDVHLNLQRKIKLMENVLNDKSINPRNIIDLSNFSSYMNWENDEYSLSAVNNFSEAVNINDILEFLQK